MVAGAAVVQQNRIREYENRLEKEIEKEVQEFRSNVLEQRRQALASMTLPEQQPEQEETQERREELEESIESLRQPFKSVVNVSESRDGKGQDVEIRLTMPVDEFMEFATERRLRPLRGG